MSRALPPGCPFIGWASFKLYLADVLDEVGFEPAAAAVLRDDEDVFEGVVVLCESGGSKLTLSPDFVVEAANYAFRNVEEGDCPTAVGQLVHDFVIDVARVCGEKTPEGFLKLADPEDASKAVLAWGVVEHDFKARRTA